MEWRRDMADHNEEQDSCNLEISVCPEPHLEMTQDLELLAQEIAEAAVDDEKRSSHNPSPTPTQPECEEAAENEDEHRPKDGGRDEVVDEDEEKGERPRSNSPVDEASWVLVDAEDETEICRLTHEESQRKSPEQKFSVFRKFLARADLRQKLADIGLSCDAEGNSNEQQDVLSMQDIIVSCSESMVICDMPQVGEQPELGEEELCPQVFLKDLPDCPKLSGWHGTFSGAQVVVEVERQGGLVVAGVRVCHDDLLSALASLQHLVTSTGLVSYADVDVPSLLARAA
ncbi:uncharacterized protein LOC121857342 isoform X2 [Homarus americanus]|uniref:uncharacterized protein LOC121857342 isoform X2 n=1 Tax=Homarus americanus TaxID=6706 RepID=UPI001C478F50|nr:uncharacterized protein LOC121857342 isoform X2 [Homarus americanus]